MTTQLDTDNPETPLAEPVTALQRIKTLRTKIDGMMITAQYIPRLVKITTQPLTQTRVAVLAQGAMLFEGNDQKLKLRAPAHFVMEANTVYCMTTLEDSVCYGVKLDDTETITEADLDPEHFFTQGLYARKMHMPAGTQVPTHQHMYDHLSILAQGRVRVTVGVVTQEYRAPAMIEIKKDLVHTIRAVEDSVWFCVHATTATDLEQLTLIQEKSNGI
jgi:hypothetical protein